MKKAIYVIEIEINGQYILEGRVRSDALITFEIISHKKL